MDTQRIPNRDENAVARVALALSLRAQKWTYEATAKRCGYGSASACRKAVMRELDRVVVQDVDLLRREELHMLDQLHMLVWEQVVIPPDEDDEEEDDKPRKKKRKRPGVNLFAVDRLIAISERRCKLMGLDAKQDEAPRNVVVVREIPMGYLGEAKSEVNGA